MFRYAIFAGRPGVYHKLALHLISVGVLEPDGMFNAKPIFSADLETVARSKAAISVYKLRARNAHQRIRELSHV